MVSSPIDPQRAFYATSAVDLVQNSYTSGKIKKREFLGFLHYFHNNRHQVACSNL
jgi:hypothetical protein